MKPERAGTLADSLAALVEATARPAVEERPALEPEEKAAGPEGKPVKAAAVKLAILAPAESTATDGADRTVSAASTDKAAETVRASCARRASALWLSPS